MKISRDNYEIWFLDYLEGRLDRDGMDQVNAFLDLNPDLAIELEGFNDEIIPVPNAGYPRKSLLKKEIYDDPEQFLNTVIASMEGDLTREELNAFELWMHDHPEKQKYRLQLLGTKLQPDPGIIYPSKFQLKKKSERSLFLTRLVSTAAILLLAFLLFYPKEKRQEGKQLLTLENKEIKSDPIAPGIPAEKKPLAIALETRKVRPVEGKHYVSKKSVPLPAGNSGPERQVLVTMEMMQVKTISLKSDVPEVNDLVLMKLPAPDYAAHTEIPISEFLTARLKVMKSEGPKALFTRQGLAFAGLRLFSWLPGKHLTGRQNKSGKLESVSLNTQLLAVSIPVNR